MIGDIGARTPEAVSNQVRLCEKHGLKTIVYMVGLPPERLPNDPACWGYILADEPRPAAFPELRKTVDALRQARPGKIAYINLCPTTLRPGRSAPPITPSMSPVFSGKFAPTC